MAVLVQSENGVLSLRLDPRERTDLGLPYQPVGVREPKLLHHRMHRRRNLVRVWVAAVDNLHIIST